MTSDFSRKLGIGGEEKAEAEGKPAHHLDPDAEGPWSAGNVDDSYGPLRAVEIDGAKQRGAQLVWAGVS
jgi:hypothetical protein